MGKMIMRKKIHKSNYTMVELLLVIAVMALLLGIGVGGLNRVMRGSGATGGIRSVGNKLTLARTFAISSNQKVAVVFPGIIKGKIDTPNIKDSTSATDDTLRKQYLFRSFRACVVVWDSTNTRYKFVRWCNGGEWTFLPGGTCGNFVDSFPDTGYVFIDKDEKDSQGDDLYAKFAPGQIKDDIMVPAVVFGASGGVDFEMSDAGELKFIVFEDTYYPSKTSMSDGEFMVNSIKPTNSSGNTVTKGWRITINQFTGAITYDNFVRQ